MKEFFKSALTKIVMFLAVTASILMIIIDRLLRFYRVDQDQPSIQEMRDLEYYRKDLIKRTQIRISLIIIFFAIFYAVKLIKYIF